MRAPKVITVDFETEAILDRPVYPPKPAGVAISWPGRKPSYFAWGHDTENNCSKKTAADALKEVWRSGLPLLFHNAKFDLEVAEKAFGLGLPSAGVHETMFLLFLNDPHSKSLALKPSAERLLNMPPEERDAVADWLVEHRVIAGQQRAKAGGWIARAPGKLVGEYAKGDVIRTLELFKLLYPTTHALDMLPSYRREIELLPILMESEQRGILADVDRLRVDLAVYESAMEKVEAWLRKKLKSPGLAFDNDSDVADALDREGIVTEWVPTATGRRSLAKDNLTPDMFNDWTVASALGYRNRLQTSLGTFMRTWLEVAEANNGRIHTQWNQVRQSGSGKHFAGARTGRLSSSNPPFMNIPKNWYDKGDGYVHPKFLKSLPELPNLRLYFIPEKKQTWVHRDYNQQELRILAHYEEGVLKDAYLNQHPPKEWCDKEGKFDVHQFVSVLIEEATGKKTQRRETKIMNFGMIYGMGAPALATDLGCSVDEAKRLRAAHQLALPGVKDLGKEIKALCKMDLPIITWGGRRYRVEDPVFDKKKKRWLTFEYKLLNYLIQGSAADCTKQALINYHNHPDRRGIFLATVHDEINVSAPKSAAKSEHRILRECMADVAFDVPMDSNGKTGPSWGSLSKE